MSPSTSIRRLAGLLPVVALAGALLGGCGGDTEAKAQTCADLPRPGEPVESPAEPGRVPCSLRPPHLR